MSNHTINISQKLIVPPSSVERFFPLRQAALLPLQEAGISIAGTSVVPPPYEVCRFSPRFHLLIFTLGGSAEYLEGQQWQRTRTGEVLIFPLGYTQAYRAKNEWKMIWFHIHEGPLWNRLNTQPLSNRKSSEWKSIRNATDSLLHEMTFHGPGEERAIASTYAALLALLLKRELRAESARPKMTRPSIHAMLQQVEGRLADQWSVDRMAHEAHLSPSQLQRLMMADLGVRPMEWVTRARMERVRQLLQHTDYKLENIASMTGYANPFALSRAFKRITGKSPSAYRRSHGPT